MTQSNLSTTATSSAGDSGGRGVRFLFKKCLFAHIINKIKMCQPNENQEEANDEGVQINFCDLLQ